MLEPVETDDFQGLQEMFLKNGLELSETENPQRIKCWEIKEHNNRVAGLRLEKRKNEFVIVGIYVDEQHRNRRLGSLLLDAAIEETRLMDGKRILLVAKSPGFFKKMGFASLENGEYDDIIGCGDCEQLRKSCFPKFMCLEI